MKTTSFLLLVSLLLLPAAGCAPGTPAPPAATPTLEVEPEQGKIVFVSDRDGDFEIYTMNLDGSGVTNITNHPANDWFPAHSPDGRQIAFASDREGKAAFTDRTIYIMNIDGTEQRQFVERITGFPSWSPDGTRIVFTCNTYKSPSLHVRDICVMNTDGTGKVQLTHDKKYDGFPNWSPDGSRIIYGCYPDGNDDVCIMNADGSGQTRLIRDPAKDGCAEWSPDGSRILFSSDRSGSIQLYLVNPDGSDLIQITEGSPKICGTWAPDGTRIVFVAEDGNASNIYIMNADGSEQVQLTNDASHNESAIWVP